MISQTAEYALRAVVVLAQAEGRQLTVEAIAGAARVPVGYLAKIMLTLSRAELVSSQRGIHGGFSLRRAPEAITVYDVVQAIDPIPRLHGCPLGIEEHGANLCPLHRCIDSAAGGVESMYRGMTIASLTVPGATGICGCLRKALEPRVVT